MNHQHTRIKTIGKAIASLAIAMVGLLSHMPNAAAQSTAGQGAAPGITNRTDSPVRTLSGIQRIRPLGPAAIDCSALVDSRCVAPLAGGSAPVCTVQLGQSSLTLSGSSVSTTVTAICAPVATEWSWQATVGTVPNGVTTTVNFNSAGSYCFSVAGRNVSVFRDMGPRSAQACATVTGTAASACTGGDYSIMGTCPSGQLGSIFTDYIQNPMTCGYSAFVRDNCYIPSCTGGRYWDGSSCQCGSGSWDGISCVSTPTCTGGQSWNGSACVCTTGTWDGSSCVTIPTCTGGQSWNGSSCVCTSGTWNGSSCVTPICTGGQIAVGAGCACPVGTIWDTFALQCVPPIIPCPSTSTFTQSCPSPTTGAYTLTTTYSGASCTPSTTSNQSSACTAASCSPTPMPSTVLSTCSAWLFHSYWTGVVRTSWSWNTATCSWDMGPSDTSSCSCFDPSAVNGNSTVCGTGGNPD
jgi:hypothetical protein